MNEFPDAFPADAVMEIIRILRAKTGEQEKHLLAKSVWNVAGFAAKVAFPPPNYVGAPEVDRAAVVDLCAALDFDAFEFLPDAGVYAATCSFSPDFWLKLLLILLEKLLKG